MRTALKSIALVVTLMCAAVAFGGPRDVSAQGVGPASSRQPAEVRVATRVVPPMVVEQDGQLSGFSIELWDALAAKLNVKSRYVIESNVSDLLSALTTQKAEVGIAAISITAERDKVLDFSQPMLGAGLQILVRDDQSATEKSPMREVLALFFSPAMMGWLGMAILFALVPAHIIWFFERQKPLGIIQDHNYIPGIFQAMWWSVSALVTQSDVMPKQWIARLIAIFWMFAALAFVSSFTAQLTAALTVKQILGTIRGPDDLPGKRVATLRGSTSVAYLRSSRVVPIEFDRIDQAYDALTQKRVDAVVFDAPIVQYYAAHDGKGAVTVVGAPFRKEDYGIAFPIGSAFRKRVDGALLELKENGTYDRIHEKWFGKATP